MTDRFYIISLGCPKNLTDSEVLMGQMKREGFEYTPDASSADMIVVNTCAFLSSARKESEQTIKKMAGYKKKGVCTKLYVAGCLPKFLSRNGRSMELSGVDGFVDSIGLFDCHAPRIKATPPWTAYVKISEGCDNNCAYCLIPSIRGWLRTRKVADVINEVKWLAKRGVKEVIFVAQDTTAHKDFPEILKKTSGIKGIKWIRVMYTHPEHITGKLIGVMAGEKKILKYIDMPIQHSSDKMLKSMRRGYTNKYLRALIGRMRKNIPGLCIRTTFIAGFPGETDEDFKDLKDFIEEMRFDRVGVFPYSREKGTKAYGMSGQISEKVKSERVRRLMKMQEKISRKKNIGFIGKTMEVLVEGLRQTANGSHQKDVIRHPSSIIQYFGRSYRDAPEIDGKVTVDCRRSTAVRAGDIVKVLVTKAGVHDLNGTII